MLPQDHPTAAGIRGLACWNDDLKTLNTHFKLIDKLLFLPDSPFVEAEISSSQNPIPRVHFTLRGYEKDKENEEDYEYNLKQFILEPVDDTHYSTTLSRLRAGESKLLSGGILIRPLKEKITINYSIHSAFSTGMIKGSGFNLNAELPDTSR